jgi:hypothetical protein
MRILHAVDTVARLRSVAARALLVAAWVDKDFTGVSLPLHVTSALLVYLVSV